MRTKTLLVLFFLLIYGCSLSRKQKTIQTEEAPQENKQAFFVSVPITQSHFKCPYVDVDIDGNIFPMKLDLGFQGHLSITQDFIDQISSKTFMRTRSMYGIRGKKYLENVYQIQEIAIGKMSFSKPILQEEATEFAKDASFVKDGGKPSPCKPGRLGWELFYNINLLLDIKNSTIAFCDSLDTLKQHGYATETFVRTPLFLEDGLIEFEAKTPDGVLRYTLDTGCTFNLLRTADNKTLEQAMFDYENFLEYSSFQIGDQNFGPITFRPVALPPPVPIKAGVVGMDFLEDYLLFLDFSEGYAYFAKDPWMTVEIAQ